MKLPVKLSIVLLTLLGIGSIAIAAFAAGKGFEAARLDNRVNLIEGEDETRLKRTVSNLHECLNSATDRYSNYIKTHGAVSVLPDGSSAYSLPESEWQAADGALKEAQNACHAIYGPVI